MRERDRKRDSLDGVNVFYRNVSHLARRCRQRAQLDAVVQIVTVAVIDKRVGRAVSVLAVEARVVVRGGTVMVWAVVLTIAAAGTAAAGRVPGAGAVVPADIHVGVVAADQRGGFAKLGKQLIVRSERRYVQVEQLLLVLQLALEIFGHIVVAQIAAGVLGIGTSGFTISNCRYVT